MDVIRPRIDERAYLGTDKSVPYNGIQFYPCKLKVAERGFTRITRIKKRAR
ncbi:MAG: hypothetical protein FWG87_06285 [Defluviitaleaceae bacterium]|nr:hypothetical protein [Defluviitaleaceae bacterium]